MFLAPGGPSFWELAQQALNSTQRGYDLIAGKFDKSVFRTPDCVLSAMESYLSKMGPFEAGLDVGCGTGAVSQVLLKVCHHRVVGLDLSEGMLDEARRQCQPQLPRQLVQFWQGNILQLATQEQFDVVTSSGMFGHLQPEDHPEMLRRIYAALRPGGRFVTVFSYFPRKRRWLYWFAWVFDLLMRLRNFIWRPQFIMYYLTFPAGRARQLMEQTGFNVTVIEGDTFPPPYSHLRLTVAIKTKDLDATQTADPARNAPFHGVNLSP